MENRWSDRRELCLVVDLFHHNGQRLPCQSRNIGLGGTFLCIDSTAGLNMNANVKLVFYLMEGPEKTSHALDARIVRISTRGVGLKFREFETGVFRTLNKVMTCKESYIVH